jgi:hypothetical protein
VTVLTTVRVAAPVETIQFPRTPFSIWTKASSDNQTVQPGRQSA